MPTTADIRSVVSRLRDPSRILVGHNLYGYDLIALERHHGLRIEETGGRVRDTQLQSWLADPPTSFETSSGPQYKSYSLDAVAERVLGRSKDTRGKELVNEFGGWDHIPIDDSRYHAYCEDDAALALAIHKALPWTPYMEREMRVQSVMARMSLNGFRVDESELDKRIHEGEARKEGAMRTLQFRYGVPSGSKSPLATKVGKEALIKALRSAGAPDYPKTATGQLQASREGMNSLLNDYGHLPGVREICELVKTVTSERTIYSTIKSHIHGDRVHPSIWPRQASGRWSVTNPGLTVVGKRGALSVEREVFLPEEGHLVGAVDLGQADMRIVAAHAQDPFYAKLFEAGRDVYTEIAVQIFKDPGMRSDAKAVALGSNYGMGQARLVEQGLDSNLVYKYFKGRQDNFPRLLKWMDEVRERGEAGEILDNGFGRPLRVDPLRAYTQAPAQMGQGGTRDLMAEGLLDIARTAPEILPMLRVVVHDELVYSAPEKDAREVGEVIRKCLTRDWAPGGASIPIHFPAELSGPASNWAACYQK